MLALTFRGIVNLRSSLAGADGPPGETEILALNPQRKVGILNATGWEKLEAGSLNLDVRAGVVEALGQLVPLWTEDGSTVIYPAPYAYIPKTRAEYWYYFAKASGTGKSQDVLVRRAKNPLPGRLELFAPIRLRSYFGLTAKDRLKVEVYAN